MSLALKNAITTHLMKTAQKHSESFIKLPVFVESWTTAIEDRRNPLSANSLRANGLSIMEKFIMKMLADKGITESPFIKHVVNAIMSNEIAREIFNSSRHSEQNSQMRPQRGMRFTIPIAIARGQLERPKGVQETLEWMEEKFGLLLEGIETLYLEMYGKPKAISSSFPLKQINSPKPPASATGHSKRSSSDIETSFRQVKRKRTMEAAKENTRPLGKVLKQGSKSKSQRGGTRATTRNQAGRNVRQRKLNSSDQVPSEGLQPNEDCQSDCFLPAFLPNSPLPELYVWHDTQPQVPGHLYSSSHLLDDPFQSVLSSSIFAPSGPLQYQSPVLEVNTSFATPSLYQGDDSSLSQVDDFSLPFDCPLDSSLQVHEFNLQFALPTSPPLCVAPWRLLHPRDHQDPMLSNGSSTYFDHSGSTDFLSGLYDAAKSSVAQTDGQAPQTDLENMNAIDFQDSPLAAGASTGLDVASAPSPPLICQTESQIIRAIFPDVCGVHSEEFSDFGFTLDDFLCGTDNIDDELIPTDSTPISSEDSYFTLFKDSDLAQVNNSVSSPTLMDLDNLIFVPLGQNHLSSSLGDSCYEYPSFPLASSEYFVSSYPGPIDDFEGALYDRLFGPHMVPNSTVF